MKIGFLHPWKLAAENQALSSLQIAAQRLGHELVECTSSDDIERHAPDFVLAAASTQPKLADVPHYGVIHEARNRFLENRRYFENLLSYDGYLTISDTLERFLEDVSFGVGRPLPVGFYYNTCQRQDLSTDLASLIKRHELQITYFGTNWDKRRQTFFKLLSEEEGVQICGPEHSWPQISRNAWGGSVPFDGSSVQKKYAANGIGLCLLSDQHLNDDIISNRIFEVTSVGAIALCCDIPWIRKNFGDSVYYFDQSLPDQALRRAIVKLRKAIYSNPSVAIEKAKRARAIFESKFAAELLLDNAVKYHLGVSADRARRLEQANQTYSPVVSVIIRCGSRPVHFIERAIRSVSQQTVGQFEIILVRHHDLDLTPVTTAEFPRIRSFQVVDCPKGNRSASLWAGLRSVGGDYFAVLDDDDWWFSNHLERLLHPLPEKPQTRYFAYSASIVQHRSPRPVEGGAEERRAIHAYGTLTRTCWHDAAAAFTSNCFVASKDLLTEQVLLDPRMDTAEDSYLILSLMSQVEPKFSYSATCAFDRSLSDQSGFEVHPRRFEDELTLQLRLLMTHRPSFLAGESWEGLSTFWGTRPERPASTEDPGMLRIDWEQVGGGFDLQKSSVSRGSRLLDPVVGSASINPDKEPWSYAAQLVLRAPERISPPYVLRAEVLVRKGAIGIGLLNVREDDFLFRQSIVAHSATQIVEVPVPNFSQIGRLVIQNWDTRLESKAELLSMRLFTEVK